MRDFDSGLTKKEDILKKMDLFAKTKFECSSEQEIQEMYQFLCGECYLYIDSCVTADEKDAKNDAAGIVEVITAFFDMVSSWLEVVPDLVGYFPYLKKYPYLYLVCPEAAILNLWKSFVTSIQMIFDYSPRSEDFMRVSSSILAKGISVAKPKSKRVALVQAYFMEAFVTSK